MRRAAPWIGLFLMLLSAACGGGQGEGGSTGTSGARETVAAPVFSPPAGAYAGAQAVTISTATPGATIRYTTDGTMPTATTGIPYAGPVVVSDPKTLKAAAFKADLADSPRSFAVYAIGGKPRIAAGGGATAAVDGDGTVWTWGSRGQGGAYIGWPTWIPAPSPGRMTGLSGAVALALGYQHGVVLKSDGTVWGFWYNGRGQLGDGTRNDAAGPVQAAGLSGAVGVSAGYSHTLALKGDGTVWSWGWNLYGQLGDGTTTDRHAPVQVAGLADVTAVAAGEHASFALKADGTVWAWGHNGQGVLGDNTTTDRATPVRVQGLDGIVAIAAGSYFTLALKDDGTVWKWGNDGSGSGVVRVPVPVPGIANAVSLAAGNAHSIVLLRDGTVRAWGKNDLGQVGGTLSSYSSTPVQPEIGSFPAATGVAAGYSHSLVLTRDGRIVAWGSNTFGQLGNGTSIDFGMPWEVSLFAGVTAVSAGYSHTVVRNGDNTVWSWGSNAFGQLGDGTTVDQYLPVQVAGLTNVSAVAAGGGHTVALTLDGLAWAWGSNVDGQLGDGSATNRRAPVATGWPLSWSRARWRPTAVAAGGSHTLFLNFDGTACSCGRNDRGQLGDGTRSNRTSPTPVLDLATALSAGDSHSLALRSDGTVWAWGANDNGQLGDGTTVDRPAPVQVPGLSGVTAIAAGQFHSAALKNDGSVWAWGWNAHGQLGDNSTITRLSPVRVVPGTGPLSRDDLPGTVSLSAGWGHTIAWLPGYGNQGNNLVGWGSNGYGELDSRRPGDWRTQYPLLGLTRVLAVSAGNGFTALLHAGGTVWTWGNNASGQLGNATRINSTGIVQVPVGGMPFRLSAAPTGPSPAGAAVRLP